MPIVSQSEFRANIAKLLDQVEADSKELIIYRQGKQPMVVIPLEQFESWKETDYLLSNSANREHLMRSFGELDRGEGIVISEDALRQMLDDRKDDAA